MAEKKVFSVEELETLSAEEINHKLIYENYSLLKSLGAEKMRKEMVPVGKVCRLAVNYFLKTTGPKSDPVKHSKAARKKLVKTLRKISPGEYHNFPRDSRDGLVVGFNHPSLGEIARILLMKVDVMGEKPMFFPVNLPWYESLAPYYDKIKLLGIVITPTITPATWQKIDLKKGSRLYTAAGRLKREFRDLYTARSREIIEEGGVIFVAPSATRQATVFKNEDVYLKKEPIIPTMSVLALDLLKNPSLKCDFLPMAVIPPKEYKRGLNLRKKYRLTPGKVFTASEIRRDYFKGQVVKDQTAKNQAIKGQAMEDQIAKNRATPTKLEAFDYDFHLRIAELLPKKFWY